MSIKNWPTAERPREKLLQQGAQALSDAELLAIFLRTGTPGLSAVDLARNLLKRFGNLRALLNADQTSFCAAPGLGSAKFAQLQAVIEMGRRHLAEQLDRGDPMNSPERTINYLRAKLRDYPYEVFAVLYLDNRHRVITYEELFRGTVNGAQVHPREVVRQSLRHNAAAVILSHNHPSGIAEPSQTDQSITQLLCKALALVDVRVLDHIIIGDGEHCSLSQRGLL
jgi:DNA repair protein RadC